MKIGIVGLGLIGGSIANDLRAQINVEVLGVDNNPKHQKLALEIGLVDEIVSLEHVVDNAEVIILAVPVDHLENLLVQVLDRIPKNSIVLDVGSTKENVCAAVKDHSKRKQYVAAHPLAGTEYSGPEAALKGLFNGKKNIICDKDFSDEKAVKMVVKIFNSIGMNTYFLDSKEHDKHLAYVSHLSHVSSFMLGQTVLDIEKDEKQIFNLASTGFESTVRLAKSNPKTWSAIFSKNKDNLADALKQYIEWLTKFKIAIENDNKELVEQYMLSANEIKRILK